MDRFFFRFVTIHHLTDGRTDTTEISSQDRVCIPCSAVIKQLFTLAYHLTDPLTLTPSPLSPRKVIGFVSISGMTWGKSGVDMSTPWRRHWMSLTVRG